MGIGRTLATERRAGKSLPTPSCGFADSGSHTTPRRGTETPACFDAHGTAVPQVISASNLLRIILWPTPGQGVRELLDGDDHG